MLKKVLGIFHLWTAFSLLPSYTHRLCLPSGIPNNRILSENLFRKNHLCENFFGAPPPTRKISSPNLGVFSVIEKIAPTYIQRVARERANAVAPSPNGGLVISQPLVGLGTNGGPG